LDEGTEKRHSLTFTVPPELAGERIDAFLASTLEGVSRTRIKLLINAGQVLCNGQEIPPRHIVRERDAVSVNINEPLATAAASQLKPVPVAFEVLHEDETVLVINKPAGLTVHPGAGTREPTLVEGVLHHLQTSAAVSNIGDSVRPGIVHRLDKDTSGVMVVAKSPQALATLQEQFQRKTNLREYVALLDGVMNRDEIEIESYLYRDPFNRLRFASLTPEQFAALVAEKGEEAVGGYRYAKSLFRRHRVYGDRLTLVTVRLFTGRTHQILVHARALGMPVVGDLVYHHPVQLPQTFPRILHELLGGLTQQLLHARLLGFEHPMSGRKLAFEAPLPKLFRKIVDILEGGDPAP